MTGIAKEYADALLLLAKESDSAATFADALTLVADVLQQQPAYVDLLASPVIPKDVRQNLLKEAFGDALPKEVVALLSLMCDNHHIREFFAMQNAYMEQFHLLSKVTVATVTSAVALSDEEKATLIEQIRERTGRTVQATYTIDASLIGGIKVEMDGCVLDGSIKHRLRELKEVMNG